MTRLLAGLGEAGASEKDNCYEAYFRLFNEQQYYEAHDVLEHLWLKTSGRDHLFYKALIQIAGAFVHLKKHFLRPMHRVDGGRLRPAVRLFRLGVSNLAGYCPRHARLDVDALCALCEKYAAEIVASEFARNPWHPSRAPKITLVD